MAAACSDWVEGRGEIRCSDPSPAEAPPRFAFSSFFSLEGEQFQATKEVVLGSAMMQLG
jgi:hypothetical protein